MPDGNATITDLKQLIEDFVSERDWSQFHSAKNLSMAISIEAAELMDLFKWYDSEESNVLMDDVDVRHAATEELADVLILCLAFANRNSIDIDDAVRAKVTKNHQKYPVEKFKGRF